MNKGQIIDYMYTLDRMKQENSFDLILKEKEISGFLEKYSDAIAKVFAEYKELQRPFFVFLTKDKDGNKIDEVEYRDVGTGQPSRIYLEGRFCWEWDIVQNEFREQEI